MIPAWLPTRRELWLRGLKWVWRAARWTEGRTRRAIKDQARGGPQTDREWERFAYLFERMELSGSCPESGPR